MYFKFFNLSIPLAFLLYYSESNNWRETGKVEEREGMVCSKRPLVSNPDCPDWCGLPGELPGRPLKSIVLHWIFKWGKVKSQIYKRFQTLPKVISLLLRKHKPINFIQLQKRQNQQETCTIWRIWFVTWEHLKLPQDATNQIIIR